MARLEQYGDGREWWVQDSAGESWTCAGANGMLAAKYAKEDEEIRKTIDTLLYHRKDTPAA